MAQLDQLTLQYQAGEDRAYLRIRAQDQSEWRFWLTRRFVRILWPVLMQVLEAEARVRSQPSAEARKAVLSFQHEHALQKTDFQTAYREGAKSFPLGEEPVLLSKIQTKRAPGGRPVVCLHDEQNRGIELALNDHLLHSLCKLLADVADKAGWDLDLSVVEHRPESEQVAQRLN
jgi:hypothetical protein